MEEALATTLFEKLKDKIADKVNKMADQSLASVHPRRTNRSSDTANPPRPWKAPRKNKVQHQWLEKQRKIIFHERVLSFTDKLFDCSSASHKTQYFITNERKLHCT
jgi:hypothetical protein